MKPTIISIFLLLTFSSYSQFFVELSTGYDYSLNKKKKTKTYNSVSPYDITKTVEESEDKYYPFVRDFINITNAEYYAKTVSLPICEGVTSSLSLGYKLKKYVGFGISSSINYNSIDYNQNIDNYSYTDYGYSYRTDNQSDVPDYLHQINSQPDH